jgi:SAM-dependent methyltransferase
VACAGARARARYGHAVRFLIADLAAPFPFRASCFDAVMSNVALHMFPDRVTRSVFAGIGRLVRPQGLFLFHVNAVEDRPLRARRLPVARELETDYVLEESGQTVRFFSEPYFASSCRSGANCAWTQSRPRTARPGSPSRYGAASHAAEPT